MCTPGRCAFLWIAGIVAYTNSSVLDSLAQTYPVKPLRIIVGFAAGGGADTMAHMLAQKLPEFSWRCASFRMS